MAWVKSGKRKGAFTHTRRNEDRNAHMFLEIQKSKKEEVYNEYTLARRHIKA